MNELIERALELVESADYDDTPEATIKLMKAIALLLASLANDSAAIAMRG